MRRFIIVFIASLLTACSAPDSRFAPGDRFIVDTTVIDVAAATTQTDMTVVIRDGDIFAVASSDDIDLPPDAVIVHRGGYVMPGLWDMHVHSLSDADRAVDRLLPLYVANGVTGIRDLGSLVDGIVATRARLDADSTLPAPEIIAAGPLLDGVRLPWYGDLPLVLTDPAEVDAALTGLLEQGIDFFKVYDQLSPEVYAAVLEFAAENDIVVAGHPPWAVGIAEAARSGQRTIEHLSIFTFGDCVDEPRAWFDRALGAKFGDAGYTGYYEIVLEFFAAIDGAACAGAIQSLADNGTFLTPTLVMEMNDRSRVVADDLALLTPEARDWCDTTLSSIDAVDTELREAAYRAFADFAVRLHSAGVRLLAGSDNPNYCLVPGASIHWELERLVEAGLSTMDALAAATVHPAIVLGRESTAGRILPGYEANLLVLSADPVDDIRNTRRIAGVVRSGQWLDEALLDEIRKANRQ